MKARCIEYQLEHAIVLLEPCWLARMLGARSTTVDLGRVKKPSDVPGAIKMTKWVAKGSGRDLDELEHWRLIRHALDFRPVAELPAAKAKLRLLP